MAGAPGHQGGGASAAWPRSCLWWVAAGGRVTEWWEGTAASLLVLALVLAPAAWLVNVRFGLLELVELPDKLAGVATRRDGPPQPERPEEGTVGAIRSVWAVLSDFGDVIGAWGAVAQLVAPMFWLLTAVAFVAVPVVVVLAVAAGLVRLSS